MTTYLEEYIESVTSLPGELQRNFKLMRELDQRSQELQKRIEDMCTQRLEELLAALQRESSDAMPSKEQALLVETDQRACLEIADEKVALAVQTYDLVDSHIRRLDKDLRKFEEELKQERDLLGGAVAEQKMEGALTKGGREEGVKMGRKRGHPAQGGAAVPKNLNMDLDLPVDPNEPTYCYCNQVSYGEMIACDNPDCKIEWFHFDCVGIEERPKGKWYCPDCRTSMQPRRRLR